jgi:hypothetical protein
MYLPLGTAEYFGSCGVVSVLPLLYVLQLGLKQQLLAQQ